MIYSTANCNECKKDKLIVNKKFNLCLICNQKRLNKLKGNTLKPKSKLKTKRKSTGEKELFCEIWNERMHLCSNCGVNLGKDAKTFHFAHIKPKSTYPQLRLEKSNIKLLCYDCHYAYDFKTKEAYESRSKKN